MPLHTARTRSHPSLDDAIRVIPTAWFRPSGVIYWIDLLVSAALGWTAFVLARDAGLWARVLLLAVAIIALYRAVLFIHEITHLAKRDLPGFTAAWNLLVGLPLLIPSFLYEQVHTDHHRQRTYGTEADPEYVPYSRQSPMLIASSLVVSLLVPLAFILRFGVLAPISWVVPAWRRGVAAHASALVINHRYVRRAPISRAGRLEEIGAAALIYLAALAWWSGWLHTTDLEHWFVVGAVISLVNAIRTLTAHRYDADAGELSMTDQLLDSCTITPMSAAGRVRAGVVNGARAIVAPVGLRYHALHHWIPSLPYHNLGRVHRLLVATLQAEAPYHATLTGGFWPALHDLLQRSRQQGRRAWPSTSTASTHHAPSQASPNTR